MYVNTKCLVYPVGELNIGAYWRVSTGLTGYMSNIGTVVKKLERRQHALITSRIVGACEIDILESEGVQTH